PLHQYIHFAHRAVNHPQFLQLPVQLLILFVVHQFLKEIQHAAELSAVRTDTMGSLFVERIILIVGISFLQLAHTFDQYFLYLFHDLLIHLSIPPYILTAYLPVSAEIMALIHLKYPASLHGHLFYKFLRTLQGAPSGDTVGRNVSVPRHLPQADIRLHRHHRSPRKNHRTLWSPRDRTPGRRTAGTDRKVPACRRRGTYSCPPTDLRAEVTGHLNVLPVLLS